METTKTAVATDGLREQFIYIRASTWQMEPDDPGSLIIGFQHARLMADDEDEAYKIGHRLLLEAAPDAVSANDYVIRL